MLGSVDSLPLSPLPFLVLSVLSSLFLSRHTFCFVEILLDCRSIHLISLYFIYLVHRNRQIFFFLFTSKSKPSQLTLQRFQNWSLRILELFHLCKLGELVRPLGSAERERERIENWGNGQQVGQSVQVKNSSDDELENDSYGYSKTHWIPFITFTSVVLDYLFAFS